MRSSSYVQEVLSSTHASAAPRLQLVGEAETTATKRLQLTRLLVNVTVDRSLWPVHVVLGADCTVADLVRAAVAAYAREGRRPPLPETEGVADAADGFELHFSKYSLESLRAEEKVVDLGSRNFFLCARRGGGDHLGLAAAAVQLF